LFVSRRVLPILPLLAGCFALHPPEGGGVVAAPEDRPPVDVEDVALPEGFRIEAVATGLSFPTGVTFDDVGGVYVVESGYSYGEVFLTPKLVRVDGGRSEVVATGANPPWNGVTWDGGSFFVAEGGVIDGGRILRIDADGSQHVLVDRLPSVGDHHTNGPVVRDGWVYFGQGTATNAAIVGLDNADFGWLARHPDFHDVPCEDVTLAGVNVRTPDARDEGKAGKTQLTGAYVPFGTATTEGQVIPGDVRCNGAILRVSREGGEPELVAWGLRNPFGLAFAPDGTLYATDNGYDARGSRPIWGNGDWLRRIEPGSWHGWPDYADGQPVDQKRWAEPGLSTPKRVLAENPSEPVEPVAIFEVHSSANGLDFGPNDAWGGSRFAYVALFGDMSPGVGKVMNPVGFRVVRADVETGVIEEFASNKGLHAGPASLQGDGGLERPVAVRFSPDGESLYVVDFGVMAIGDDGPKPVPGTGVLWKISRSSDRMVSP
jgi:sugar lactone lactonase YvrE